MTCAFCRKELTQIIGRQNPNYGDVFLCAQCTGVNVWENGTLRKITFPELKNMPIEAKKKLCASMFAVRMVRENKRMREKYGWRN